MKDSYYFHNEHQLFRKSLKDFLQKEVLLNVDSWEENGRLPKSIFKKKDKPAIEAIKPKKSLLKKLNIKQAPI